VVHFGSKKYYTGIVAKVHDTKPEGDFEVKDIYAVIDSGPIIRDLQLRFWEWISFYYMCKMGDVYKAAIPSGLKLESETVVSLNRDLEIEEKLKPNETKILYTIGEKPISLVEIEKRTGIKNIMPPITSLMDRGYIIVAEKLKAGYKPKTETYVRLSDNYASEEKLNLLLGELKKAKRQEELLRVFLEKMELSEEYGLRGELKKSVLLRDADTTHAVFNALQKRGVFDVYEKEINRLKPHSDKLYPLNPLSEDQQSALDKIQDIFKVKDVCLLHGVTSSGKTEVYIHLIQDMLEQGKQVLYLLPEIAVTTQIIERLSMYFGDKMKVYHSKFSDNERVEVWNSLLHSDEPCLVLGVRSSLFLPFSDLGLVIVDEEHEVSYKQQDPAPRYHARNAAIVLASMHGGKVLLGSATPSLDSYFNARRGKYGLVELTKRYGEAQLPKIGIVDLKALRKKKILKDGLFSPILVDKINNAIANDEQVILFQNRRGFAPLIECRECGWVPRCVNCDVSLTYHKYSNELVCHYCGYKAQLPRQCPQCGHNELKPLGVGTEKVEEEVKAVFPGVEVGRMDQDTARSRASYERIIGDFEQGKNKILIGTQMLSKGFDFGNVSVVGIVNADAIMNYPDFRAYEKAYQLMTQVSGRSGRRDKQGEVILQTSQSENPIIRLVRSQDYQEMARQQLTERKQFRYPPYYRLIEIVMRGRDDKTLSELADIYAGKLRECFAGRVNGPVVPVVTRVQNLYIRKIIIKFELSVGATLIRNILETVQNEMYRYLPFKQLLVHYDVDPS
jgi:primosomal protein N' (replication factor Y)